MLRVFCLVFLTFLFSCSPPTYYVNQPPTDATTKATQSTKPNQEMLPAEAAVEPLVSAPASPQICKIATVSKKTRPLEALAICGLMAEDQNLSPGDVCRTFKIENKEAVDCSSGKDTWLTLRTVEKFKTFHMQAGINPSIEMYYWGITEDRVAQFRMVIANGRTGTCDVSLQQHEARFCETSGTAQ